jgi:hypothetical protein
MCQGEQTSVGPPRTTQAYLLLLLATSRRFWIRVRLPLLLIGHDDVGARVVATWGARFRSLGFVRQTLCLERAVVRPALQLPQPRFDLYVMA